MTQVLGPFGVDLFWSLGWAAVLVAVLWLAEQATALLPLSSRQREAASRRFPLLRAALLTLYALLAVPSLFADFEGMMAPSFLLALGLVVAIYWRVLREGVAGIALRAEGSCRIDARVRIGQLEGRIIGLGPRALRLETQEGEIALVPYTEASRAAVVETQRSEQPVAHAFRLPRDPRAQVAEQTASIRRAALRCHWAAVARPPAVVLKTGELEVTVYAIDAAHGPDVESAVRQSLAEPSGTTGR